MMTSLESVCQLKSSLSPVQIQILVNSERVLQFVSDISHREVCVYVPGRKKGDMVLVARRLPFSRHRQPVDIEESIGTAATVYEEPLVQRVFQAGLAAKLITARWSPCSSIPLSTMAALSWESSISWAL